MVWNSLYHPGCHWIPDAPALFSWVLGLHVWTTSMPSWYYISHIVLVSIFFLLVYFWVFKKNILQRTRIQLQVVLCSSGRLVEEAWEARVLVTASEWTDAVLLSGGLESLFMLEGPSQSLAISCKWRCFPSPFPVQIFVKTQPVWELISKCGSTQSRLSISSWRRIISLLALTLLLAALLFRAIYLFNLPSPRRVLIKKFFFCSF